MSAISIILTTYNSETWLEKVLWGYTMQSYIDFELIIADDGSTNETKNLIEKFQNKFKNPIIHVWQKDEGFQKTKILNKAIVKASCDYILFSDGDCIPRNDFVATHFLATDPVKVDFCFVEVLFEVKCPACGVGPGGQGFVGKCAFFGFG